jgi:hypothetical protein
MNAKLNRRHLAKFLQSNRWAWTPLALVLIPVVPIFVIVEYWDDVKKAYSDLFKLLTHQVDSGN